MDQQSDSQLREIIANYYGMISLLDHNVGRIMAVLDELDLSRNTLVVFTSDHGEWLGDHGLMLKGPMFYEGLLRVGLVVRGPGVMRGKVVGHPVSTVDLAATFADFAAVPNPAARHSRSLRPLLEGAAGREFAYSEWKLGPARCGVALDLRLVRTQNAKLTLELGTGAGEMYLLDEDPHEMNNRFDDPGYRTVRNRLTEMIHARPNDMMSPLPPVVGAA